MVWRFTGRATVCRKVRPHKASLSDRVLCDLMMSKCNSAF